MSSISRRRFLQGIGASAGAAALAACGADGARDAAPPGSLPPGPAGSAPLAPGTSAPVGAAAGDGTLVVITLSGGNDALNTVAPIGDPAYAAQRAALALDPATTHDVGEGFALHPALTQSKGLFDAGRLAIVHGVGFADLDRSHFHCMDVWQAADDDLGSGWIGRWLDTAGTEPIDAIVVGTRLPLLARGSGRSAAVVPTGPFALPGDAELRTTLGTLDADDGAPPLQVAVARSTSDLLEVVDRVGPAVASTDGGETLTDRLATIATLVEAGLPTRVYATDLGGFDTHANQPGQHEALLTELDAALGSFLGRTGDRPVTVLVYTEFGRRVVPNASSGTDHGKAGTVLVAGHVRGGHHGDPPPLADLDDGDLRTTVDYRSVYGGLLEGVLGIEAGDVIDGAPAPLTLV